MLEVNNLQGGYSGKEVLHHVSFTAQKGQVTVLLGPNGCGKSTLLKSICGIVPARGGEIVLDGENLLTLRQNRIAQKVAYLAQSRQTPEITAGRLVLHGRFPYLRYPRQYRQTDYAIARQAMERMQILDLADTPLSRLSGGQQQKVYLAMALAQDTEVVLLDEPTTYLDVAHQLQVLRQVRLLADSGKYVVMVIHDLCHGLEAADHVVLMKNGSVVMAGSPEEAYETGALNQVFEVRVMRVQAEGKWLYTVSEASASHQLPDRSVY